MSNMAYGGYMPEMGVGGKMPAEIARARFAAAGNLDKLDDYGYAYGGDIYGGQMDMDAMYQMMKGGQPCYECGGKVYKQGGIYINPANKGKFTESANRAGMGVQEFARHVLANKEDYSSTQVKRANFAHVFGGRNYQDGGYVMGEEYEMSDEEIQDLINKGYKVEYV